MPRFLIFFVLSAGLCSSPAWALRLGPATEIVPLGRPLNFSVELHGQLGRSFTDSTCISADVMTGDRALPAGSTRTRIEPMGSAYVHRIRVDSTLTIEEPVIYVTVRLKCPQVLVREFVVFAQPVELLAPRVAHSSGDTTGLLQSSSSVAHESVRAKPMRPSASVRPGEVSPAPSQLSPHPSPDPGVSMAQDAEALHAPGSYAARLATLQDQLERLQGESQARPNRVAAPVATDRDEWSMGWAVLSAMLGLGWMFTAWRGRVLRQQALLLQVAPSAVSRAPVVQARSTSFFSLEPRPDLDRVDATPVPAHGELTSPEGVDEHWVDLEQQVEFFMVLGHTEAAIDLLMAHLRSTAGLSPWPYLLLLAIYVERGEAIPFERLRERFTRHFNSAVPAWGQSLEAGRSLEDYPEILGIVQKTWKSPAAALDLLHGLVYTRGSGEVLDLPAYRDLLTLYGLAQAWRDGAVSESVDLLLPIGADQSVLG